MVIKGKCKDMNNGRWYVKWSKHFGKDMAVAYKIK